MGGLRLRFCLRQSLRLFALPVLAALLVACANEASEYVERPVEQIYNDAYRELQRGSYGRAAAEFEEVERQHPYSIWARRAIIMAAYAHYLQNEYDTSILTARRFLNLYPGDPQAIYVQYLVAQSLYEQIVDVSRDQRITELAQAALLEVMRRAPDSDYAKDAQLKYDLTRDHLAGKEMEIGRYYLDRYSYLAAIKRFRRVIDNYQTTTHAPEALHRLAEAYLALGVEREARLAAAILGHNFPASPWYRESYRLLVQRRLRPLKYRKTWIGRAWSSLFSS